MSNYPKGFCQVCGKPSMNKRKANKFCSPECRTKSSARNITCMDCGKQFKKEGKAKRCPDCREKKSERCPITGHAIHKDDLVLMTQYSSFYSLMRRPPARKKRVCLRCQSVFRSNQNNRTCPSCMRTNARQSPLCGATYAGL